MSASLPSPNPHVAAMSAYTPGEQPQGGGWVKLNTNENPYPPSLRALEAIRVALLNDGLPSGSTRRRTPPRCARPPRASMISRPSASSPAMVRTTS